MDSFPGVQRTVAPVDAASIVLARQPFDVYMTLRPRFLTFAGGFYVFPGGGVDPADAESPWPELPAGFSESDGGTPVVAAAIRELFEEVGLLLCYDADGRALWRPEGADRDGVRAALEAARERLLAGESSLVQVLRRHGWRAAVDRLRYVGRWVTPPGFKRRYDTRFFLVDATGAIEPTPYTEEVEDAEWMPLRRLLAHVTDRPAIEAADEPASDRKGPSVSGADSVDADSAIRRIPLMPPTYGTLRSLACHADLDGALAFFSDPVRPRVMVTAAAIRRRTPSDPGRLSTASVTRPSVEIRDDGRSVPVPFESEDSPFSVLDVALASVGVHRIPIGSPTLAPWGETNVYLVVDRGTALLIDGGAGGEEGAERVRTVWERVGRPRLKAIALTHGHPDHCSGIPALMDALGPLPVWAHPAEQEELARHVPLEIHRPLRDGECLHVGALPVTVLHTPGHARGHLAFWLQPHGILMAGDMAIAGGSVWVGPPDGDLTVYLDQLRRLSDLPVELVAPAHGPVFAGARKYWEALIERRLKREQDILALLAAGPRTVDDMVDALYGGKVPAGALFAARRTVLGHVEKLVREKRVVPPGEGEPRYRIP